MPVIFCEEYELLNSLFLQLFPHPSVRLRSTWTHNLNLCSTINVVDQDLHTHTHTTTCKTIFLYISSFEYLDNKWEDAGGFFSKIVNWVVVSIPRIYSFLNEVLIA